VDDVNKGSRKHSISPVQRPQHPLIIDAFQQRYVIAHHKTQVLRSFAGEIVSCYAERMSGILPSNRKYRLLSKNDSFYMNDSAWSGSVWSNSSSLAAWKAYCQFFHEIVTKENTKCTILDLQLTLQKFTHWHLFFPPLQGKTFGIVQLSLSLPSIKWVSYKSYTTQTCTQTLNHNDNCSHLTGLAGEVFFTRWHLPVTERK